jgi:flagellar biosynthetic protein FliR
MFDVIYLIFDNPSYFMFMAIRVGGLILSSPIFGRINVPMNARIMFSIVLTHLFMVMFPPTHEIVYTNLIGFVLICVSELLIGIALAFVTNLFFTTILITGHMIDRQIGFGIVSVFDIQHQTQIPITGTILNMMMLVVFLIMNGHLRLVEIIALAIEGIPIGTATFSPGIGLVAVELFIRSFLLGIMASLPIVAAGFLIEVILGILMRMVPQVHMFVVGIPLKMFVGLIVFMFSLQVFVGFTVLIFDEMFSGIERMFATFGTTG